MQTYKEPETTLAFDVQRNLMNWLCSFNLFFTRVPQFSILSKFAVKCQDNIYTILFFQNSRWVFLKSADCLKWSFEDVLLRDLLGFLPDSFRRAGWGARLLPQTPSLPDLWLYHFRFISCFLSTRFFLCSSLPAATGWLGCVGTSPSGTYHILSKRRDTTRLVCPGRGLEAVAARSLEDWSGLRGCSSRAAQEHRH